MRRELSAAAKRRQRRRRASVIANPSGRPAGLETRLSALTEQLTALKSQPAPAPAAPVAAPVKKTRLPRPLTSCCSVPSRGPQCAFVLTGVEKRGQSLGCHRAPGYSSLSQVAGQENRGRTGRPGDCAQESRITERMMKLKHTFLAAMLLSP